MAKTRGVKKLSEITNASKKSKPHNTEPSPKKKRGSEGARKHTQDEQVTSESAIEDEEDEKLLDLGYVSGRIYGADGMAELSKIFLDRGSAVSLIPPSTVRAAKLVVQKRKPVKLYTNSGVLSCKDYVDINLTIGGVTCAIKCLVAKPCEGHECMLLGRGEMYKLRLNPQMTDNPMTVKQITVNNRASRWVPTTSESDPPRTTWYDKLSREYFETLRSTPFISEQPPIAFDFPATHFGNEDTEEPYTAFHRAFRAKTRKPKAQTQALSIRRKAPENVGGVAPGDGERAIVLVNEGSNRKRPRIDGFGNLLSKGQHANLRQTKANVAWEKKHDGQEYGIARLQPITDIPYERTTDVSVPWYVKDEDNAKYQHEGGDQVGKSARDIGRNLSCANLLMEYDDIGMVVAEEACERCVTDARPGVKIECVVATAEAFRWCKNMRTGCARCMSRKTGCSLVSTPHYH